MYREKTAGTPLFAFITVFYLWLLNGFANSSLHEMYLALVPALFLLIVLIMLGLIHRFVLKIFVFACIFIASVTIFFKWRYHATVTEDIILSGLINDSALSSEMFSFSLIFWIGISAILPIFLLSHMHIKHLGFIKELNVLMAIVAITLMLVWMQGYKSRAKGQIRDYKQIQALSTFSPLDTLYAFKKAIRAYQKLGKEYAKAQKNIGDYQDKDKAEDRLIVLVVGESTRGDHLALNGYSRETTPNLDKIENLYSFHHAYSCDTLTIRSMHYMFSPLECKNENKIKKASFVQVFRSLGYRVEIYSLQTLNAFYHYLGYDKLISKYTVVHEQPSGTKDISLLPYVQEAIKAYHGGKKLIIVHTLGSHQIYSDRVSRDNNKFTPACNSSDPVSCSKKELIDSYDNTIVAIDDFLSQIIMLLKKKNAMLMYLSDHGESLGENGVYFHGKPRDIAPKEQFEIPFVVWFSKQYLNTQEAGNFQKWVKENSLDTNISHNYLYHSILGCSGVLSKNGALKSAFNFCKE